MSCDLNYHHFEAPVETGNPCQCGETRLGEPAGTGKVVDLAAVRAEQGPHWVIETGLTEYDPEPLVVYVVSEQALLDYAFGRGELDARLLRRIVVEWSELARRAV